MADPLPLNPESPDVEVVAGTVAPLLRALYRGKLDSIFDASLVIPQPVSLVWDALQLDCRDASWVFDAGSLDLELRRSRFGGDEQLNRMFRVMNRPAELVLEGGSSLTARLAHLVRRGNSIDVQKQVASTTYTISLDSWTWWPPNNRALWVGPLDLPSIDDGNLTVCGDGWWTSRCIRLVGNYVLYLLNHRKAERTTLVVDTVGRALDQSLLGTDFVALEFALGRPLRLDHVVAVDEHYDLVGAAGLEFGGWSGRSRSGRCPAAGSMDLYANYGSRGSEHLWVPVLFSLVADRLEEEGADSALLTAVGAYLDSIAAGNIHVSYLLVQIALEALSTSIAKGAEGSLVADRSRWQAFVQVHEEQIRSLARDEKAGRTLLNKMRHNVPQAPRGDQVLAAFGSFGLDLPAQAVKEIGRRNKSAHEFVMAQESTADIQELADRLAMVQTLLVAIIAKHVGFSGPIIGWEWLNGRHKIPEWWNWEAVPAARQHFMVLPEGREGDHVAPDPQVT